MYTASFHRSAFDHIILITYLLLVVLVNAINLELSKAWEEESRGPLKHEYACFDVTSDR
jgi:hypothetical protein